MARIVIILLTATLLSVPSSGFCQNVPDVVQSENLHLHQLAVLSQSYIVQNKGRSPQNLDQIKNYVDLRELLADDPRFLEKYAFPSDDITLDDGSRAILIRVSPFGEGSNEQGRYVGFISKEGVPGSRWYAEDSLKKIVGVERLSRLRAIGGGIPAPTELPKQKVEAPTAYEQQVLNSLHQKSHSSHPSDQVLSTSQAEPVAATQPRVESLDQPASYTRIPVWLYGVIVLSIAVIIGAGYYLFKGSGKGP